MTLSKAVIAGKVVRTPEKRFTGNNVAITSFAIDIGENGEESLLKVVAAGNLAEKAASDLKKDSIVVVEGRLQTNTVKNSSGEEKRIIEIMAQNFDVMSAAAKVDSGSDEETDFLFDEEEVADDLIGEDEIPF